MWPSKLALLEGIAVRVPHDITAHLTEQFGRGWAADCVSSGWDHVQERRIRSRLKGPCSELQAQCGWVGGVDRFRLAFRPATTTHT